MDRSDLAFLEPMFNSTLAQIRAHVLVVNQSVEHTLVSDFKNIKVINSREYGLSKSRNLALKAATKTWCWFLDDDVVIKKDAIAHIIKATNKRSDCIVMVFKINDFTGKELRGYHVKKNRASTLNDLRAICSIELVVNKDEVTNAAIVFNEQLGLGTDLPVGEEFVFTAQLFKAGYNIAFEKAVVASHDSYHSGLRVMDANILSARGFIYEITSPLFSNLQKLKYLLFLVRKGHIKNVKQALYVWNLLNSVKNLKS